jgi:hypothetical protein
MKRYIDYLRKYVNELMEDLDALEASRPQHMDLTQLKQHVRHIENFDDLIGTLTKEIKTVQLEALEHVVSREKYFDPKGESYAERYYKQLKVALIFAPEELNELK